MSELPITKNEYDKSVILVDFLSEFKEKTKDNENIKNVIFLPEIAGYCIKFDYNDIPSKISLSLNKSKFKSSMKVKYIRRDEELKTFLSRNKKDNQEILNQILQL